MNTIIIGGGQAGLATSYQLSKHGIEHVILEANQRVATSWSKRYDALKLITPNWMNSLDGLVFPGEKDDFSSRDDVVKYLDKYAEKIKAPIKFEQKVIGLSKIGNLFHITTEKNEVYSCANVILATGPFQNPKIPSFSRKIEKSVFQIHSGKYKNTSQLIGDTILVVGSGNSGVQIAIDSSKDKKVYLSKENNFWIPRSLSGTQFLEIIKKFGINDKEIHSSEMEVQKDFMCWMQQLGLYDMPLSTAFGQALSKGNDPFVGQNIETLLDDNNVMKLGKCTDYTSGKFQFDDNRSLKVDTVIWATGYDYDYSWVNLPILNNHGQPLHENGISQLGGLYFIGLRWMSRADSGLLKGVSKDAKYIAKVICNSKINEVA